MSLQPVFVIFSTKELIMKYLRREEEGGTKGGVKGGRRKEGSDRD